MAPRSGTVWRAGDVRLSLARHAGAEVTGTNAVQTICRSDRRIVKNRWPRWGSKVDPLIAWANYGSGLRSLWKASVVGHDRVALAPSHEAAVEPEYSAGAGPRQRRSQARQRLHRLHQVGQDR